MDLEAGSYILLCNLSGHYSAAKQYAAFTVEERPRCDNERRAAMAERVSFTSDEARRVGSEIGIDWASAPFDVEQFRTGMDVELEEAKLESAGR